MLIIAITCPRASPLPACMFFYKNSINFAIRSDICCFYDFAALIRKVPWPKFFSVRMWSCAIRWHIWINLRININSFKTNYRFPFHFKFSYFPSGEVFLNITLSKFLLIFVHDPANDLFLSAAINLSVSNRDKP